MSETALPAAPPPRRGWLTFVLWLLIFGGGAVVGAGATALFVGSRVREAILHPEAAPHRIAERLRRRLDLTDEQAGRIEQRITELQGRILEARSDFLDRVDPVLDQIEEAIAAELPADKVREFRERFDEVRDEWVARPERALRHLPHMPR